MIYTGFTIIPPAYRRPACDTASISRLKGTLQACHFLILIFCNCPLPSQLLLQLFRSFTVIVRCFIFCQKAPPAPLRSAWIRLRRIFRLHPAFLLLHCSRLAHNQSILRFRPLQAPCPLHGVRSRISSHPPTLPGYRKSHPSCRMQAFRFPNW